jgi:hypothetical protein
VKRKRKEGTKLLEVLLEEEKEKEEENLKF